MTRIREATSRRQPKANASPRCSPAPASARAATPSAGSPTAASRSTAGCSLRRRSTSRTAIASRRRRAAAGARAHPALALQQARRAGHHGPRSGRPADGVRRAAARTCRAWSPSAGSTSTPRACSSSPMTAASRACSSCPRPAGSAATGCAPMARSTQADARHAQGRRRHRRRPLWRRRGDASTGSRAANVWLTVGLREGKNREVKRVLAHLGLDTNRLIRISYGPFQLGDLTDGEVRGDARPGAPRPARREARRGRRRRFRGAGPAAGTAAGATPARGDDATTETDRAVRIVGGEFGGRPLADAALRRDPAELATGSARRSSTSSPTATATR